MTESLKSLLEKLENQGKLKKQKAGVDYLNDLLHAADRNFLAAAANIDDFEETAFKAAYDGILQISKVVLLLNGYKTDDGEQHKTTFEVAGAILGSKFGELINKINVYSYWVDIKKFGPKRARNRRVSVTRRSWKRKN